MQHSGKLTVTRKRNIYGNLVFFSDRIKMSENQQFDLALGFYCVCVLLQRSTSIQNYGLLLQCTYYLYFAHWFYVYLSN